MAGRVHRITMFKAPKADDQQKLIEQYKVVDATNQKVRQAGRVRGPRRLIREGPQRPTWLTALHQDGKPYILSLAVGVAEEDPRSQGFTVVCKTEFASLDDLKYYDDECQAHQSLKAVARTLTIEGIQTVYFTPQVIGGSAP